MKQTRIMMGMTITVEVLDSAVTQKDLNNIFNYLEWVDRTFSTYKPESEISSINAGSLKLTQASPEMREIFDLAEKTKEESKGYFDIKKTDGTMDPSGIVKGWMIQKAADQLRAKSFNNFYIDAGGDIQAEGKNNEGRPWRVGIRSPFNPEKEIVKVVELDNKGMATSGTYARGQHIYNPHNRSEIFEDIVSLTVIGPNAYEADRFATAAFAMGRKGIEFIESLPGFEGYMIDKKGIATMTSNFDLYVLKTS